jgi:hypothetical protein
MARYSISGRTGAAPSSTLPGVSLYAISAVTLYVAEIHLYNTTTTACMVAVNRLTTAGTQGSGLTEAKFDPHSVAASGTGFANHSVGPTVSDELMRASIGAAIGAGVIWTFDAKPIRIEDGTGNGIGILTPTGTGQVLDYTIIWDE